MKSTLVNTGSASARLQPGQINRSCNLCRSRRVSTAIVHQSFPPVSNPLRQWFHKSFSRKAETELGSVAAYDLWSGQYDQQPGNLMLDLDEELFTGLLSGVPVKGKRVADIGCGTGRHWPSILKAEPASLTGFDNSPGMLARLKEKFPTADTVLIGDSSFPQAKDGSFDLIVSTLTLAHIADAAAAVKTWCRLLAPGGHLLITDFHPDVLASGGKRTFVYQDRLIAVRNYVFPVEALESALDVLGMKKINKMEKLIDASLHHYYVAKNAEHIYDRYLNAKMIYGLHYVKH